jgi:hypothetical protein
MKKILLFIVVIPLIASSQKRTVNLSDEDGITPNSFYTVAGEPFVTVSYTKIVEGSPYFKNQWLPGVLVSSTESKAYKAEKLKLDLITNQIHFIDKDGEEKIATADFKEIRLYDSVTNSVYKLKKQVSYPDATKKDLWHLELVDGAVCLYKYIRKQILTSTSYGSTIEEQRVRDLDAFFISANNKFYQVKSATELSSILNDKEKELQIFIKNLKDKKNKAAAIIQTVEYYNSMVHLKSL